MTSPRPSSARVRKDDDGWVVSRQKNGRLVYRMKEGDLVLYSSPPKKGLSATQAARLIRDYITHDTTAKRRP